MGILIYFTIVYSLFALVATYFILCGGKNSSFNKMMHFVFDRPLFDNFW